jgi:hypothetical protein
MIGNFGLLEILNFVLLAWLITLTVLLVQTMVHYRRLTKNAHAKDLKTVLTEILDRADMSQKQLEALTAKQKKSEVKSLGFIQKIGFVRFNPFPQTGGDQSFSLALLDANDNGFVLSSLHSRDHTRLYAKAVKKGSSVGHELSKEEREALKNAQ